MNPEELQKRIEQLESWMVAGWRRELSLAARVAAHREFLVELIRQHPLEQLSFPDVEASLDLLTENHRQQLLSQWHRESPAAFSMMESQAGGTDNSSG